MPEEVETEPGAPDLADPDVGRLLERTSLLALAVAAEGAAASPPLDVPAPLRPLLRHRKLTAAAHATLRKVVDQDPAFRERVAVRLSGSPEEVETAVGAAGLAFLRRPEGWRTTFSELLSQARLARAAGDDEINERRASRRLRSLEERVPTLEAAALDARAEADMARQEAQASRRAARLSADEVDSLKARLHAAERTSAEADAVVAGREADVASLEALLATSEAARVAATEEAAALQAEVAGLRAAWREAVTNARPVPAPEPEAPADPKDAAGAIALAARAAAELGAALERASEAMAEERDRQDDGDEPEPGRGSRPRATPSRRARALHRHHRRRPCALPPLVLEESDAAADHLVRLDGVTILVDGYNATLSLWPELDLVDQRQRLVDLLAGLAARFGSRIEVVFDGADVVDVPAPPVSRSLVRIDFSAPDVEADDVLIERAADRPLPVVVVSDDRRVRDGARRGGANVLFVAQLVGAARRG